MRHWDSGKFQEVQSQYLGWKLASVQSTKLKKLDNMITTLSNEKQILEFQFQQELDLYIGNKNADIIDQIANVDERKIDDQMQQQFKSIFGVELNHDEHLYTRLEELNEVLTRKVDEAKNIEPLLALKEEKLSNYNKCEEIRKDIKQLENLADIEFLSKFV